MSSFFFFLTFGGLEAQGPSKLPSQTVVNLKKNACAITLRRETQLEKAHKKSINNEKTKYEPIQDGANKSNNEGDRATDSKEAKKPCKVQSKVPISTYEPPLTFPSRFTKKKKEEHEQEILDTF